MSDQYLHSYLSGVIVNAFLMENGHGHKYVTSEIFQLDSRIKGSIDIMLCEAEGYSKGVLKPILVEIKTSDPPNEIWKDICPKSVEFERLLTDSLRYDDFLKKNDLEALRGLKYQPGTAEFVVFSYRSTFDQLFSIPYGFTGPQDPKSIPPSLSIPPCKVILWALDVSKGINQYRITYAYGNIGGIPEWENCSSKSNNYCINASQDLVSWLVNGDQLADSLFSLSKPEVIDRHVNIIILLKTTEYFLSQKLRFTEETALGEIYNEFNEAKIQVTDKYVKELFEILKKSGIFVPQHDPLSTFKVRRDLTKLVRNLGKIQINQTIDPNDKKKEDLILFLSKFKYRQKREGVSSVGVQTHFDVS